MERERFVNAAETLNHWPKTAFARRRRAAWQPQSWGKHRPGHMFVRMGAACLLVTAIAWPASGQSAAARASVSATLQPALTQVGQALSSADPQHWKAPHSVKSAVEDDIEAIQRDLNGTLAGLLQQADAAPGSVPAEFQAYRNVDALYDTLLRVVETAQLAAPEAEANALETARANLETARSQMGDSILSGAQAQQNELIQLNRAIRAAATAERTPTRTTVVNDYGSATRRKAVRHSATKSHKAPAKPATSSPPQPQTH